MIKLGGTMNSRNGTYISVRLFIEEPTDSTPSPVIQANAGSRLLNDKPRSSLASLF